MHGLNFITARNYDRSYNQGLPFGTDERIIRVYKAFCENMSRISAFSATPQFIEIWATKMQEGMKGGIDKENFTEHELLQLRVLKQGMSELFSFAGDMFLHRPDPLNNTLLKRSDGRLSEIDGANVQCISLCFESLIQAQVISCWTAFEAVSIDLWEEAINVLPIPLALIAINAQSAPEEGETQSAKKNMIQKFIETTIKEEPEVIADIGAIIRRSDKFNFTRLEGIQAAYQVFGTRAKAVFESPEFFDMKVLEGFRNVLVHRAVYPDERFRARVKEIPQEYKKFGIDYPVGEGPIRITGDVASRLTSSLVKFVVAVFSAVVNRLSSPES
jgi:hypothetical protein